MVKENNLKYNIALLFIISLGIYMRYTYMIGAFLIEDDFSYTNRALEIYKKNIDFSTFTFSDYRFLIYAPQAIIYYFFGFSTFTIVLWPFILSVLHIYLAYKISFLLYKDYTTALVSSFLMAIIPVNVIEVRLYPDAIFSFFLSLSVFLLLKSAFSLKKSSIIALSLCSFFVISVTFLVRENAFLIFPFFISIFFLFPEKGKKWKKALLIYMLFVSVVLTVSMLFPINFVDKITNMIEIRNTINWESAGNQISFFPYFNYLHHQVAIGYGIFSVFLIGAVYLLRKFKNKHDIIVLFWFFTIYIYFEFISPLHGLRPVEGSFRYFTPFVVPIVLIISRFINHWVFVIENESTDNKIIFLTIVISIILQIQFEPKISLLPFILFFFYSFSIKKDQFLLPIQKSKMNLIAISSVVFLFMATFMYTSTASHAYDRITLNRLTQKIHSNLLNTEQGLIASNNFMVERKLNLFMNGKFIDRNSIQKDDIVYIILIGKDISETSYKSKQLNDDNYNNKIFELIQSKIFTPISGDNTYQIFKKLQKT
jgi:4-amino-4-deoxy-L-arabinose transferase-like glycosyltransferase